MAIDALTLAHAKRVDQIILVTGDGDFTCLVRTLQQLAIKVVVVSSVKTKPPMVADTLRRAADTFVDLDDLPWSNPKEMSVGQLLQHCHVLPYGLGRHTPIVSVIPSFRLLLPSLPGSILQSALVVTSSIGS